ncbi:pyruvate/2-oxoglutarate dehydrogenase complex dihydrolipoamide acyltransferase (E2) component [Bradyrhizobium sp. GM22.5]
MTSASDAPSAYSLAEMLSRPISVAVVEAEAEQEAERVHMRRLGHQAEHRAEQPRQQSAAGEQRIKLRGVVDALRARDPERPPQAGEDDQVDGRDHQQEQRRHRRADEAADVLEQAVAAKAHQAQREQHGRDHNHGGMTKREIETNAARRIAGLHQLAHDVVDGRDVVGIDGVAQAEHPGKQRGRHHRRPVTVTPRTPKPTPRCWPRSTRRTAASFRGRPPAKIISSRQSFRPLHDPSHERYDLSIRWSY